MKLTNAILMSFTASVMWGGTILNSTSDLNPLRAGGAAPQTVAQLANLEVLFNFGSFTDIAFFNGATGEASSSLDDGILVNNGSGFHPLTSNPDSGNWIVENNSGNAALLGLTLLGSGPGLDGLTAFDTTLEAVCGGPGFCPLDATGLYSAPIGIGGNPPTTLFGSFTLTFAGNGLAPGRSFVFQMDSELLTGPVTAAATAPEPSPLLLLLSGGLFLVGLPATRRPPPDAAC